MVIKEKDGGQIRVTITELNFTGDEVQYEYEVDFGSTSGDNIYENKRYRQIAIINERVGYKVDVVDPDTSQDIIVESGTIPVDGPTTLKFQARTRLVYADYPIVRNYDRTTTVTVDAGNPTGRMAIDGEYDFEEDVGLTLWDAVADAEGERVWAEVELVGSLSGGGYYQFLEGPTKDDKARDVTGVTPPDMREVTYSSGSSQIIAWYIHPALESDLVAEGSVRELGGGETFPGGENESRVEVANVSSQSPGDNTVDVTFEIENVVVSGDGKTVDYNANVEVDSWLQEKINGTVQPEEVVEHEVTLTGIEGGTKEVCVWV